MTRLLLLLTLFTHLGFAQNPTQTIRGVIRDKKTKQLLPGATIVVLNSTPTIGAATNEDGVFELKKVPTGRVRLQSQFIGYQPFTSEDIILLSTKEPYLEIELSEGSIAVDEVVISASKNAFEPVNELSVVSTRSFTVDETERVAAGVNDPGRVALSYPGVHVGQDDTENQIVVRGNSPIGVLWRLEGIDIPNPNHFAVVGSAGGGLTVFSAQLLARSDFSTGGMSAEYGNAISGAFDMHFRLGNLEKREYRAKIGILGLDFATEGPIMKGRSSYLVNYRYSTLGLLNKIGFNLVGERVSNDFQDLSFNLTFKSKNNKSITTVFGIGGLSEEHYYPVEDPAKRNPKVFNNREEQSKPSNVGATGITWTYLPNTKSYFKAVVALMASEQIRNNDTLDNQNIRFRYSTENYQDTRLATSLTYSRKMSEKTNLKTGIILNQIFFNFYKNTLALRSISDVNSLNIRTLVDGNDNTQLYQQYAQIHTDITPKFSLNAGFHFLYLAANQTKSLEPRLSMQFQPASNQRISLAYGLHSRVLPMMTYFLKDADGNFPNKKLDLLKTHHAVLAYHLFTKNKMRISLETYLQRLFNVPVVPNLTDNYWMLNNSSGFPTFKVVSEGKGLNYGIDAALEKLFSNSYFFLLTGSVFKSNFQPFNGQTYQSRFSTNFSSSVTFGKEFNFRKGRILQVGGRFLYSGGFRYTPYDPVLSKEKGVYIALKNADFSGQVPAYQRLDTRIAYRFNARKIAGNIALDVQNILNRINPSSVGYDAATNSTFIQYRGSGFIPLLSCQFDF